MLHKKLQEVLKFELMMFICCVSIWDKEMFHFCKQKKKRKNYLSLIFFVSRSGLLLHSSSRAWIIHEKENIQSTTCINVAKAMTINALNSEPWLNLPPIQVFLWWGNTNVWHKGLKIQQYEKYAQQDRVTKPPPQINQSYREANLIWQLFLFSLSS